jgi:hypothetical protein
MSDSMPFSANFQAGVNYRLSIINVLKAVLLKLWSS